MKKFLSALLAAVLAFCAAGCGAAPAETKTSGDVLPGTDLQKLSSMELAYADQFAVDYYEDGYKLLSVSNGDRFLLVPEGKDVPEGLDASVKVLRAPVTDLYMASSSAMALFDAMDSLDVIRFSATQANGWYVENAAKAMQEGRILFAGKYSEPDYEALLEGSCGLAVENTMLLHSPKVKDMIEQLGIPVLVEYSSYESHPLGRTEWIRFYGALLDREEQADAYFETEAAKVRALEGMESTGKSIGFFYLSASGRAVVYSGNSYIASMVREAGGEYIFDGVTDEDSSRSSVNITLEDFFARAADADYLVYNASIDEPVSTLEELIAKNAVLADLKAVKEGNVWCTGKYMYQATDIIGSLVLDLHKVLTDDPEGMAFLYQLH